MGVQCTVYILNITLSRNLEKGKEMVMKYKGKGGYSAEGLEQRVTYIIRIMFMNYRVLKLIKGTVHQFELKKEKKKKGQQYSFKYREFQYKLV